jgi:hypothetical protein
MNDDRIGRLLREALPPTQDNAARRDAWPSLVEQLDEKPRWSLLDIGLGAAATVSLLLFPESLWLLVYHL